jgi:flagellar biogenesis protein FliO
MFWPALALVAMVTAFGFVRLAAAMAAVLTAMHLLDRLQAAARQSKNTR